MELRENVNKWKLELLYWYSDTEKDVGTGASAE